MKLKYVAAATLAAVAMGGASVPASAGEAPDGLWVGVMHALDGAGATQRFTDEGSCVDWVAHATSGTQGVVVAAYCRNRETGEMVKVTAGRSHG